MSERKIEMELPLAAAPEDVWTALTEARELMRWFPLKADVQPGRGGNIRLSWADDVTGNCPIDAWEPGRHLRMFWWEGQDTDPARRLAVDFFLESDGGQTRLRLVHSGFGHDASWDEEYDGISRGWQFELRCLRQYLENFLGRDRNVAFRRLPLEGLDVAGLWQGLVGQKGLFQFEGADQLTGDGRFRLTLPDGQSSAANLMLYNAFKDFAAVLDVLDGGILRLGVETCGGSLELWVWAMSWTVAEETVTGLVEQWCEKINRLQQAA